MAVLFAITIVFWQPFNGRQMATVYKKQDKKKTNIYIYIHAVSMSAQFWNTETFKQHTCSFLANASTVMRVHVCL